MEHAHSTAQPCVRVRQSQQDRRLRLPLLEAYRNAVLVDDDVGHEDFAGVAIEVFGPQQMVKGLHESVVVDHYGLRLPSHCAGT